MIVSLMLAGCWDERLFKNSSVVSLAGFEGEMGDLTGYYAYPEATTKDMKTIVIVSKGKSPRDVRQDAELKTEQTMDLSVLSTILISEDTAKGDIYEYLDVYFRDPTNPITPRVAIVQGELKPFFELTEKMQSTTGEFYNRFINSLEGNSLVIPYNLQTAGSVLFESAQDLALPYIKLDKEQRPLADGLALFSGHSFTGETLTANEGLLVNILNKSLGKSARLTYLYKESPASVRIKNVDRKVAISEEDITIDLKIEVALSEFPQATMRERDKRKELERFLASKIEEDMDKTIGKLQHAKSDAIGLGRLVRAYHPDWFDNWHERFATLNISTNVELEIIQTGILY